MWPTFDTHSLSSAASDVVMNDCRNFFPSVAAAAQQLSSSSLAEIRLATAAAASAFVAVNLFGPHSVSLKVNKVQLEEEAANTIS